MYERNIYYLADMSASECVDVMPSEPFCVKMKDGVHFRIDTVTFIDPHLIRKQATKWSRAELKFCVDIDEADESSHEVEQWRLVIFPMFNRDCREIIHGEVVDYEVSPANGNIVIINGKVSDLSSNHTDPDYKALQNPITLYAGKCVATFLENR